MKYFGRLAGATDAEAALNDTTAPSTQTPLVPATPGSKMLGYGEVGTSLVFNRAIGAVSANTDYLAGILDMPALRYDTLEPEQTDGTPTTFGSSALVLAPGATEVSLGLGTRRPLAWVYHGLFLAQVGDWIRLSRVHAEHRVDLAEQVPAADVRAFEGGPSVFGVVADTEIGSTVQRLPMSMAPMQQVATNLTPYNGASFGTLIESWDEDGLYVGGAVTLANVYGRPGAFVEVYNDNSPSFATGNNGLYQIAHSVRSEDTGGVGDKVVLTRGGLHRVTVSGATSTILAGARISWESAPNHAAPATIAARTNYAYVAYKISSPVGAAFTDLYLLPTSGSEDLSVVGGTNYGVNSAGTSERTQVGQVGLVDQEDAGSQNHGLLVGTIIYQDADPASLTIATVTAVEHAGSPIAFNTSVATGGRFYLVSPPGFALNPSIILADNISGGSYTMDCRTLTTRREQLMSSGNSSVIGQSENPADRLGLSKSERTDMLDWFKFAKVGTQADSVSSSSSTGNKALGAPATILGEMRWSIQVVNQTTVLTDADVNNQPGHIIELIHPTEPSGYATAEILSVSGNTIVLAWVTKDISGLWSSDNARGISPIAFGGPLAGSIFPDQGIGEVFRVTSIDYSPTLMNSSGTPIYPELGLDALYSNTFGALTQTRYTGSGRFINMPNNSRPISLLFGTGAGVKQGIEYHQDGGEVDAGRVMERSTDTVKTRWGTRDAIADGLALHSFYIGDANRFMQLTDAGHIWRANISWTGLSLAFSDANIGITSEIDLSSPIYDHLPPQTEANPSILGAIHGATPGTAAGELSIAHGTRVFSDGLIGPAKPVTLSPQTYKTVLTGVTGTTLTKVGIGALIGLGDVVALTGPAGERHYATVTVLNPDDATIDLAWPYSAPHAASLLVVDNPFVVEVAESALSSAGAVHRSTLYDIGGAGGLTALALAVAGTFEDQYINWTASSNTMAVSKTASATPGVVTVAGIWVTDTAVEAVKAYQAPISRVDTKTVITVGKWWVGTNDIARANVNDVAHFDTIGDAFNMIAGETALADAQGWSRRGWEIRIVGDCTQDRDHDAGIELPLLVPCDGVTICGHVTDLASTSDLLFPEVRWTRHTPLFCTNNQSGFTIKNVRFRSDPVGSSSNTWPERTLIANTDVAGTTYAKVDNLVLDNVHVYGAESFLYTGGITSGSGMTIRDCSAREMTSGGIIIRGCLADQIHVSNFHFESDGAGGGTGSGDYAILFDDVAFSAVRDSTLLCVGVNGVKTANTGGGSIIVDCSMSGVYCATTIASGFLIGTPFTKLTGCTALESTTVGFYVEIGGVGVEITDCQMRTPGAYALWLQADESRVTGGKYVGAGTFGATGVYILGSRVRVAGAVIDGFQQYGVYNNSNGADPEILDNTFRNLGRTGIRAYGAGFVISGNKMADIGTDSVYPGTVYPAIDADAGGVIRGNTINYREAVDLAQAILVSGTAQTDIVDNTLIPAVTSGSVGIFSSSSGTISGNTLHKSATAPQTNMIDLTGSAGGNFLSNNVVHNGSIIIDGPGDIIMGGYTELDVTLTATAIGTNMSGGIIGRNLSVTKLAANCEFTAVTIKGTVALAAASSLLHACVLGPIEAGVSDSGDVVVVTGNYCTISGNQTRGGDIRLNGGVVNPLTPVTNCTIVDNNLMRHDTSSTALVSGSPGGGIVATYTSNTVATGNKLGTIHGSGSRAIYFAANGGSNQAHNNTSPGGNITMYGGGNSANGNNLTSWLGLVGATGARTSCGAISFAGESTAGFNIAMNNNAVLSGTTDNDVLQGNHDKHGSCDTDVSTYNGAGVIPAPALTFRATDRTAIAEGAWTGAWVLNFPTTVEEGARKGRVLRIYNNCSGIGTLAYTGTGTWVTGSKPLGTLGPFASITLVCTSDGDGTANFGKWLQV